MHVPGRRAIRGADDKRAFHISLVPDGKRPTPSAALYFDSTVTAESGNQLIDVERSVLSRRRALPRVIDEPERRFCLTRSQAGHRSGGGTEDALYIMQVEEDSGQRGQLLGARTRARRRGGHDLTSSPQASMLRQLLLLADAHRHQVL
jgi:hypothetical protein